MSQVQLNNTRAQNG